MNSRPQLSQACWIQEPGRAELQSELLADLQEGQALVRTRYTALSRGTESLVFAGRVPESEYLRMRAPFQSGSFPGPLKYGYINVGVVEEGPEVWLGRDVFCLYPHQDFYVVGIEALTPIPEKVPCKRAVLAAGMETALNALWDAEPKLGDRIAVVGGGVIGCLCAYLAARIAGCQVTLVDSNAQRYKIAEALDFSFALPQECTGDADLVVHASGTQAGLHTALALAGVQAKIVELSWYGDQMVCLPLGEAFHARRLQLRSSQVGTIPSSQQARWDFKRRLACALSLLEDSALDCLISGESEFVTLPGSLAKIIACADTLCHRIRYPDPESA